MDSIANVLDRISQIQQGINAVVSLGDPHRATSKVSEDSFKKILTKNLAENAEAPENAQNSPTNEALVPSGEKTLEKTSSEKSLEGTSVHYSSPRPSELKTPYADLINEKAKKYDLSFKLLNSLIKQESNYDPYAVSNKGAMGLMQLMPDTARKVGVDAVFSPEKNVEGGSRFLKQLLGDFGGDVVKALAAYNAGSQNVTNNKAFKFDETKNYVNNIIQSYLKPSKEE